MIEASGKRVIVTEIEQGERKVGNIIVQNDDGKRHGIRSRWCKVYRVGDKVTDIKPGQWILVEHGRWSYRFDEYFDDGTPGEFWIVDYPKYVMAVSDERPDMENRHVGSE